MSLSRPPRNGAESARVSPRPALPRPAALPLPHRQCRLAARLAANHYDVTLAELLARARGPRRVARARHLAMYLAHVAYGLDFAAVGAGFGRDRTTAAYACRNVEDAREDPAFDAALAGLERSAVILIDGERGERAA